MAKGSTAMTTHEYLEWLTANMPAPEGWITHVGYVLKNGREYTLTADSFKGRRMLKKECYRNAGMMALRRDDLTYVEGYAMCGPIPIEHAWLADEDGNVIDPTIRQSATMPMSDYFGVPFTRAELEETIGRTGVWGIISVMTNRELFRLKKLTVTGHLQGMRP